MQTYLAEFIGTAILVFLGDAVVAGVTLRYSKVEGAGWLVIALGWACALAIAVFAVGRVSGAHLNPAVTLGLASTGQFSGAFTGWTVVPGYIIAQTLGAFLGAVLVYLHYLPHWKETEDPRAKLGVYSTSPAIRNTTTNLVSEFFGTFVLVFGVLAISTTLGPDNMRTPDLASAFSTGISPLVVGLLLLGIGLSLGGTTGYAINPARDLGPRIAHAILPIPGKGGSDWSYAWIPVLAPIVGGICGAFVFTLTLAS